MKCMDNTNDIHHKILHKFKDPPVSSTEIIEILAEPVLVRLRQDLMLVKERKTVKRVLFICTRNSARSQMAEALVNHDLAGEFEAFSAGTEPSEVHPSAIAVMKELYIDISSHRSKGLDEFAGRKFDYVITLCSQADEACPVFFGGTQKIHMGFPDPAIASGSDEERLSAFRKVRDQIRSKVIESLRKSDSPDSPKF
jgi:arsenate reductase